MVDGVLFSEPRLTTVELELDDDAPALLNNFPLGRGLCSISRKAVRINDPCIPYYIKSKAMPLKA